MMKVQLEWLIDIITIGLASDNDGDNLNKIEERMRLARRLLIGQALWNFCIQVRPTQIERRDGGLTETDATHWKELHQFFCR